MIKFSMKNQHVISLKKKNILDSVILFPFIWVTTGMFLYPDGKKLMVLFVLMSVITSIYSYGIKMQWLNIKNNKLLWLIGTWLIFALFSKLYHGYGSSVLRVLFTSFLFFASLPPSLVINKINFKTLIIISALTSMVYLILQVFILDLGRNWTINPIPYATFSTVISIIAFHYLLNYKSKRDCFVWLIIFIIGVIPLLYSQTRGLWLALGILIIFLTLKMLFSGKKSIYLLIPLILALIASYHLGGEKITQRISQTQSEIQQIIDGNMDTSIGQRLQMWKAAIILSQKSPLLGLGDSHAKYKKELVDQHVVSPKIIRYSHYHNQFLNTFVKGGFLGLVILLLSIILPAYYLIRNKNKYTWPGLLIIATYIIASLTDVPFHQAQTLTYYFILIFIIFIHTHQMKQE